MSNPQTGRRKVRKSSISLGTIIFWGFIGWFWFGDSITGFFEKDINVTVNEEQISVNIDDIMDEVKTKIGDLKDQVNEEIAENKKEKEKPKPEPHPDEGKVMTAAEDKKFDDRYGDYSNADKY